MPPPLESLRHHWFVACSAAALGNRPVARTILGLPIVLFRSGGKAVALVDRCPHRNAALSQGRITGNEIECPYHGWAFDGEGTCIRIPGMSAPCDHAHQRAQSVRVIEREKLVWVHVGDGNDSRPALPLHRHVSFADARFDTFLWPASAQCALVDVLENLLDACHPHFAHAGQAYSRFSKTSTSAH